jgi:hypothetical protein
VTHGRLDVTAENLVVPEHDSGDDSGLRVGVHVELLGYDREVVSSLDLGNF